MTFDKVSNLNQLKGHHSLEREVVKGTDLYFIQELQTFTIVQRDLQEVLSFL